MSNSVKFRVPRRLSKLSSQESTKNKQQNKKGLEAKNNADSKDMISMMSANEQCNLDQYDSNSNMFRNDI